MHGVIVRLAIGYQLPDVRVPFVRAERIGGDLLVSRERVIGEQHFKRHLVDVRLAQQFFATVADVSYFAEEALWQLALQA